MNWDSIVECKNKTKDFIGGESLVSFKEFVAGLPDQLGDNMSARIFIEVVTNK